MQIVGELGDTMWAWQEGGSWQTGSWSLRMAPTAAAMKVSLAEWMAQGSTYAGVLTGITSFNHRPVPNGPDETIKLPSLEKFDAMNVIFVVNMTRVTYGMKVTQGRAKIVWSLQFWGP